MAHANAGGLTSNFQRLGDDAPSLRLIALTRASALLALDLTGHSHDLTIGIDGNPPIKIRL
jgi:hypothetical protein